MNKKWNDAAKTINFSIDPNIENTISQLHKKAKILDIGCGYGRISQQAWEMGYKNIIGYDCSPKMIERGHKEFPHLNLNITSSNIIPEPTESTDFVILCAVLTCIPNINERQKLIAEVARTLKDKGIILICEFAVIGGKTYSTDGTFCSSLGIMMKHFNKTDLENELEYFSNQRTEIFNTKSLDGSPAKAIRFYGEKHIA